MKKDEKCFYCDGKGKVQYRNNPELHICTVCGGSGINFRLKYKRRIQGKNKCKYCGQPCSGYACNSCLESFESEKEIEND